MKKIVSLVIVLMFLLQIVPQAAADQTFILADLDSQYSFTVSGVIDYAKIAKESPKYIVIDKNSTITFNCPMDILMVGAGKGTVLDFDGVFSEGKISYGDGGMSYCSFNGRASERQDNAMVFNSYENVEPSSIYYINEGASIQFRRAGHYDMWVVPGTKTAEERKEFEAKYADNAEKIRNEYYYIQVVDDASDYVPYDENYEGGELIYDDNFFGEEYEEIIVEEPIYEEPVYEEPEIYDPNADIKEYDENLINISGISHFEYDRPTINYHDRVAVCNSPVAIEIKQDLKMFVVTPLAERSGAYIYDDENMISLTEVDEWVYDSNYDADIIPAKKGQVLTLTDPGLYNVFAEKDYMGDWTELIIEIPDQNATYDAIYTSSKVMVDGKEVKFEAYNIGGNNYFKLRDIAYVLSGTQKQFNVEWDAVNQRINLASGLPYTSVGGELAGGDGLAKQATNGSSNIAKDGVAEHMKAYLINGNNYFKLRDLGKTFDFGVSWDGANNCVLIDSNSYYVE